MSNYSEKYQRTHDIDWFANIHGKLFHFASNGGKLPDVICDDRNALIQRRVESLNASSVVKTSRFIRSLSQDMNAEDRENYLRSFYEMASKGFISCDNISNDDFDDPHYRIIASPNNNNAPDLPYDLMPKIEDLSAFGFSEEDLSIIDEIEQ